MIDLLRMYHMQALLNMQTEGLHDLMPAAMLGGSNNHRGKLLFYPAFLVTWLLASDQNYHQAGHTL